MPLAGVVDAALPAGFDELEPEVAFGVDGAGLGFGLVVGGFGVGLGVVFVGAGALGAPGPLPLPPKKSVILSPRRIKSFSAMTREKPSTMPSTSN